LFDGGEFEDSEEEIKKLNLKEKSIVIKRILLLSLERTEDHRRLALKLIKYNSIFQKVEIQDGFFQLFKHLIKSEYHVDYPKCYDLIVVMISELIVEEFIDFSDFELILIDIENFPKIKLNAMLKLFYKKLYEDFNENKNVSKFSNELNNSSFNILHYLESDEEIKDFIKFIDQEKIIVHDITLDIYNSFIKKVDYLEKLKSLTITENLIQKIFHSFVSTDKFLKIDKFEKIFINFFQNIKLDTSLQISILNELIFLTIINDEEKLNYIKLFFNNNIIKRNTLNEWTESDDYNIPEEIYDYIKKN
jgi:hypothetical protein